MAELDVIEQIYKDHARIRRLLARLRAVRNAPTRQRLQSELQIEVRAHCRLERTLLYQACQAAALTHEDRTRYADADTANQLLEKAALALKKPGALSSEADPLEVLQRLLDLHVDATPSPLLLAARRVLPRDELLGLGVLFRRRQKGLLNGVAATRPRARPGLRATAPMPTIELRVGDGAIAD